MTSILHLLKPGSTCDTLDCTADHVRVPEQPLVTLYGTTWKTREGVVMSVSEMHPRHALNTWCYLHRTAWRRAMREVWADAMSPFAPQGEMACDAVDEMHDEMMGHPHRWLDETPLLEALWARVLDGLPSAR